MTEEDDVGAEFSVERLPGVGAQAGGDDLGALRGEQPHLGLALPRAPPVTGATLPSKRPTAASSFVACREWRRALPTIRHRPTAALPAGPDRYRRRRCPIPRRSPNASPSSPVPPAASAERSLWLSPTPAPTSRWPTCTPRRSKASSGTAYAGGCRGPRRRCRRRVRWPPSGAARPRSPSTCPTPTAVADAIARCTDELGPPDVVVNNAGIVNNIAPIAGMSPDAWAARAAGQPVGHVPRRAGGGTGDGRARLGQGDQRLLDRRDPPRPRPARLRRVEGRRDRVHQGGGPRVRAWRRHRQRHPARADRHATRALDAGAPARPVRRAHPGRAASASRRTSPPLRRSSPHRPPASSAAWRSPATAASRNAAREGLDR